MSKAHVIRNGRAEKGWSQRELADATGVDVQSVRNWEKGSEPRAPKWAEIKRALGLDDEPWSTAPSAPPSVATRGLAGSIEALRQALAAELGISAEAIKITIEL